MNMSAITKLGVLSIDGVPRSCRIRNITRTYGENPLVEVEILSLWEAPWEKKNPYLKKSTNIKKVIFNEPVTVVIWDDDTKTVVKCQPGDVYDEEKGLAMCIAKKYFGNKGNFNEVFKKWQSTLPKFLIKETCDGCRGAEGLIGRKTNKPHTDGLLENDPGYNVETDSGRVWRINHGAKIEYLK